MLDTNMVIYTMKNRPEQVRQHFKQHQGQMCISSVTLGEQRLRRTAMLWGSALRKARAVRPCRPRSC